METVLPVNRPISKTHTPTQPPRGGGQADFTHSRAPQTTTPPRHGYRAAARSRSASCHTAAARASPAAPQPARPRPGCDSVLWGVSPLGGSFLGGAGFREEGPGSGACAGRCGRRGRCCCCGGRGATTAPPRSTALGDGRGGQDALRGVGAGGVSVWNFMKAICIWGLCLRIPAGPPPLSGWRSK